MHWLDLIRMNILKIALSILIIWSNFAYANVYLGVGHQYDLIHRYTSNQHFNSITGTKNSLHISFDESRDIRSEFQFTQGQFVSNDFDDGVHEDVDLTQALYIRSHKVRLLRNFKPHVGYGIAINRYDFTNRKLVESGYISENLSDSEMQDLHILLQISYPIRILSSLLCNFFVQGSSDEKLDDMTFSVGLSINYVFDRE
jgi:hypothetical protein